MKINFKTRKFAAGVLAAIAISFFVPCIFYYDISKHNVEVQEKSPLFPYSNYDYMTIEDSFYNIDGNMDVVPAYFRTDFASIPKVFWLVEAPYKASFIYASIWHDYYYTCPNGIHRKTIDEVFYTLLRTEGNSLYTSLKMYIAVRLFGWTHFNNGAECKEIEIQIEDDAKFYKQENPNE